MMYGIPTLPGFTDQEALEMNPATEVDHTMYNVFNKTICVCYYSKQ